MQFLLTCHDGKDPEALDRRMAARPAHLANSEKMREKGSLILGAAMLNDEGKMCGSIIVLNVSSREEVDKYLKDEPYTVGNVWQQVEVQQISVGAHYMSEAAQSV
jgi:uncharacterized protein YciI